MQDWFREHQILKKVLVVQLPRHLEFLEMLVLLEENGKFTLLTITPLGGAQHSSGHSTDQGEQEAADGACSLTEGAVLLQEHGDELVGLRRTLRCGHSHR